MKKNWYLLLILTLSFTACEEEATTSKSKIAPTTIAKTEEVGVQTITGSVLETSPIQDLDDALWFDIETETGEEFYLVFHKAANPERFDAMPQDIVGKKIQAFYTVKRTQIALDVRKLGMIAGKAQRDYDKMLVYTIKGKQTAVEKDGAELVITLETDKGTLLKYRADAEVYLGAKPEVYNNEKVQIVYTEEEELLMNDFQLLEQ